MQFPGGGGAHGEAQPRPGGMVATPAQVQLAQVQQMQQMQQMQAALAANPALQAQFAQQQVLIIHRFLAPRGAPSSLFARSNLLD